MRVSHSCNRDPDLYRKVKESVSMQQAAAWYGLRPDRRGLCMCPFHQDTHPSMRLYDNGRGFYCFSCGTGGDVIKFAAMYRGLSNYEAAKELAAAFSIPVAEPVTYKEKREAALKQQKRLELADFIKKAKMYLTVYRGLLCDAIREQGEHFWEGLWNLTYVEYLLDCLETCPEQVFASKETVKEIGKVEGRIINWYLRIEPDGTISR